MDQQQRQDYFANAFLGRVKRLQGAKTPWNGNVLRAAIEDEIDVQDLQLTEEQRAAMVKLSRKSVMTVSGAPGAGQTVTMKVFLAALVKSHPELQVALCAPTGRAAKRRGQTLGMEVKTLQGLLNPVRGTKDFEERFNNPMPYKVVVVFDVEQAPAQAMQLLSEALAVGTALIMVGEHGAHADEGMSVLPTVLSCMPEDVVNLASVLRQQGEALSSSVSRPIDRGALLLRFKDKDGPLNVTRATLAKAADELGMNETQLIHLALRSYIRENIPAYDPDVPPLTKKQIDAIKKRVPQNPKGRVLSSLKGVG